MALPRKGEGREGVLSPTMHSASPSNIQRARALRKQMTQAEVHLWRRLQGEQIAGCRFRRQVPIGTYIADFACMAKRLIIEVDGEQHGEDAERDLRRTAWLQSRGFRTLRFWNQEVLTNTEGVVDVIAQALEESILIGTPSQPSPQGGGK
jgi:very-short-patch-repair endonuclease